MKSDCVPNYFMQIISEIDHEEPETIFCLKSIFAERSHLLIIRIQYLFYLMEKTEINVKNVWKRETVYCDKNSNFFSLDV